jgi:hypothetical protein
VPDEPGWMTGGVNGALECFNADRGELHLGLAGVVCMPGGMTATMAPMYGWIVAPLMQAHAAVTHVWPQLRNAIEPGVGYGYVEIVSAHPLNWGTGSDTGMFQFRYQRGSVQWHGNILASTMPLPNDDRWLLYYSQLGVPETDDGSVYQGLNECWKAYDVSKARSQPGAAAPQPQQQQQPQPQPVQPNNAAAIQAQKETSKLLDEMHRSLQESRQETYDKHNAAWLEQMKQ